MNLQKILQWLLFLFVIYLIYEIMRKIFGGSLSFEQVNIGLLLAIIGYLFYMNSRLSEHMGWHKGRGDIK